MSTMPELRQLNESLLRIERQGNALFQSCRLGVSNRFVCAESEIGGVQLRDYLHGIEAFLLLIKVAGFCVDKTKIELTNDNFKLTVDFSWEIEV